VARKLDALFARGVRIQRNLEIKLCCALQGCAIAKKNVTGLRSTSWVGLGPEAPGSSHYVRSDIVRGGRNEADTESLYSRVTVCRRGCPYRENP
jgi:hypothetical protein